MFIGGAARDNDIEPVEIAGDPAACKAKMERAMAQFAAYCRRNRIAPEPSKTQLMMTGTRWQMDQMKDFKCKMGTNPTFWYIILCVSKSKGNPDSHFGIFPCVSKATHDNRSAQHTTRHISKT